MNQFFDELYALAMKRWYVLCAVAVFLLFAMRFHRGIRLFAAIIFGVVAGLALLGAGHAIYSTLKQKD